MGSRKITIKPGIAGRYPASGRTIRIVLPFLGVQVMLNTYNSSFASNFEINLHESAGKFLWYHHPWNKLNGVNLPSWCSVKEPTDDLLAICHINPSTGYGCPIQHPSGSGVNASGVRDYTATHPIPGDGEFCKYSAQADRDLYCAFDTNRAVDKYAQLVSNYTGYWYYPSDENWYTQWCDRKQEDGADFDVACGGADQHRR